MDHQGESNLSHDEESSTPALRKKSAAAGTTRERIERSGARLIKSRSPSSPGPQTTGEYSESSPPSSVTPWYIHSYLYSVNDN